MRLILLSGISMLLCFGLAEAQVDYDELRKAMVENQLEVRGIRHSATLEAMRTVPRHKFVPEELQIQAYNDHPLPIGQGQTISQPYIVAFMTETLQLKKSDKVLEIGTGSGYQAAVLAQIVDSVYTIEIVEKLALAAKKRLGELQYGNISVKAGDGYHGWPEKAPFDAVIVTAGAEYIPEALVNQLKPGGRLTIPVGPHNGTRQLQLFIKKKNRLVKKNLMAVRFVPLTRAKD
ncbi:protein-L-isoaspartate(D-aspartate) O-methyltransferase [Aggregatimonas sangjinii]|uniref:Protein-L-isoaspartate O-methyltransferase n=1 Tax=Aggregatimonas sangjinii TaxID=2583587 RepID=A0A5B7SSG2_9FLAO|nr:protein-L-isoaspartate(D-aspartate) O-methyltransferase [Aggregatimonas sangjinii]QCW99947.1 protein-L-isoaspartate(D-aspartate) O-methyltransferase [Aggregatimonas sangjinii]